MKWLKICALIVFTLGAMRAGSWTLGWVLARLATVSARFVAIVSNVGGFGVFVLLLFLTLLPGEPVDMAAVVFGLLVFAVYCMTDLCWRPWKPKL